MTVGAIRPERQTLSSRRTVGRPSTPAIEQAVKTRHLYWKIVWRFTSVCLLDRVEGLCDSCGSFFIDPEVWTNRESAADQGSQWWRASFQGWDRWHSCWSIVSPTQHQTSLILQLQEAFLSFSFFLFFFVFFFCIFYLLDANWCLLSFSCPWLPFTHSRMMKTQTVVSLSFSELNPSLHGSIPRLQFFAFPTHQSLGF